MKFLIVFAIVGLSAAFPGYTPEVERARHEFFSAYNTAARAANAKKHGSAIVFPQGAAPEPVYKWMGPVAATIPAGLPGASNVIPTTDVAAATAAFQQAYNAAVVATTGHKTAPAGQHVYSKPAQSGKWTGPYAATVPAGLPGSGNVIDTAEVSAAKAAFNRQFLDQLVQVGGAPVGRF